ncbi:unnamed protein product [Peronospora destructor]|uniref:Protein kinase domain-containing protein n=1 Tax=Peronospora destructor TaxID=86335 RepID=A0AAV0U2G9_9STRA|nr:unnamed protein product [Peronospora destructor]
MSGRFPFKADELLGERIMHEEIDLKSPPWTKISNGSQRSSANNAGTRYPAERVTAEQALKHPWLASSFRHYLLRASTMALCCCQRSYQGDYRLSAGDGTLVQRLQLYRSLNILERAALNEVTCLLPLELKQDVIVLYSEVSRNGSEIVGLEEFAVYVAAGGYPLTKGEAKGFSAELGPGRFKYMLHITADAYVHFPKRLKLY